MGSSGDCGVLSRGFVRSSGILRGLSVVIVRSSGVAVFINPKTCGHWTNKRHH